MVMYVNTNNKGTLNLRQEPSGSSRVLARIPYGTEVDAEIVDDTWAKLTYKNIFGYVMREHLGEKNWKTNLIAIRDELKNTLHMIEEALK